MALRLSVETINAGGPTVTFMIHQSDQNAAWLLENQQLDRSSFNPEMLREFVRESTGIDAFVLHDGGLPLGPQRATVLMEAQNKLQHMGLPVLEELHELPNARPWQRPGWYPTVVTWLDQTLAAHGHRRTGPVIQVSSWDLACVLRADATCGRVFFKAGDTTWEVKASDYLARAHPDLTVPVFEVDMSRGWLLTQDGGRCLSDVAIQNVWIDAITKLARFQVETDPNDLEALQRFSK